MMTSEETSSLTWPTTVHRPVLWKKLTKMPHVISVFGFRTHVDGGKMIGFGMV